MIVCYHYAYRSNRESILADGLRPYNNKGESAAEQYGNEAGAAVYMWRGLRTNKYCYGRNHDLWAVEVDETEIQRDPSNLGPLGAVYVKGSIPASRIRLVGSAQNLSSLTERDMDNHFAAYAFAKNHPTLIAHSIAEQTGLPIAELGQWDYEEDGAYYPIGSVCIVHDPITREMELDESGNIMVMSAWGALTLREYALKIRGPLHGIPLDYEYALMPAESVTEPIHATARAWADRYGFARMPILA